MKPAKLNYIVDAASAVAFIASAVSGLVFLLPSTILSMAAVAVWDDIHLWSSLTLVAGVGLHVALHWKWIIAMTKKMLAVQPEPAGEPSTTTGVPSRRAFLTLAGLTAVVAALAAAGLHSFIGDPTAGQASTDPTANTTTSTSSSTAGNRVSEETTVEPAESVTSGAAEETTSGTAESIASGATEDVITNPAGSNSDSLTLETVQEGVACRFGIVNDFYPGQCHHYRDSNGDGLCDYSIPGSGDVTERSSPGGSGGRPGRSSG